MMKDENWYELVVGDKSRSGGQWDIWEATYSPVGPDGYPKRLWNKETGDIDKSVARAVEEIRHGRHSPHQLAGARARRSASKLHIYIGDMDSYYLNDAVEKLNEFLVQADDPKFTGEVVFQRRAPHCWGPRGAELLQKLDAQVEKGRTCGNGEELEVLRGEEGTRESACGSARRRVKRRGAAPPSESERGWAPRALDNADVNSKL